MSCGRAVPSAAGTPGHFAAGTSGPGTARSTPGRPGAAAIPAWLAGLPDRAAEVPERTFSRFRPPEGSEARESAVLMLFGPGRGGDDAEVELVVTERAHTMRSHAGQAAFPGGRREQEDSDLIATALREAEEEIGLVPASVEVITTLPVLHLPVSDHNVLPVVGWWRRPGPVGVRDPAEVARVVQVGVRHLVDPVNRFSVRHSSGYVGPAFDAEGLLIWGFTAGLLDATLRLAGIDRPWDPTVIRELP